MKCIGISLIVILSLCLKDEVSKIGKSKCWKFERIIGWMEIPIKREWSLTNVKRENERNGMADGNIQNYATEKNLDSNDYHGDSTIKKVTAKKLSLSELKAMKIVVNHDSINDSVQNFIQM